MLYAGFKQVVIDLNEGAYTEPCGRFTTANPSDDVQLINCPIYKKEFSRVRVEFYFDLEFRINEIEVHTLGEEVLFQ